MAYTVLLKVRENKRGSYVDGKFSGKCDLETYWYSHQNFDVFSELAEWILTQARITTEAYSIKVSDISVIEPYAGCMCED